MIKVVLYRGVKKRGKRKKKKRYSIFIDLISKQFGNC